MAISPNKEFVAICEKMKDDDNESKKKSPYVSVYEIKKTLVKSV